MRIVYHILTYFALCGIALKITLKSDVNRKYVLYYIQSAAFQKRIKSISTATAQPAFNVTKFRRLPIPLPSLTEQERIVARIEELFSELDNGMETLKTVKAQLKVYRQAVLKEAYSSRYSARTAELLEIVSDIRIGPFGTMLHKSDYISGGVPVINPQHIKNSMVVYGTSVTISPEKAEELSAYKLRENDIIMGRRGEMGRTAPITSKEKGWICGTGSILLRIKPEFDAVFYSKILSSPDTVHSFPLTACWSAYSLMSEAHDTSASTRDRMSSMSSSVRSGGSLKS